MMNPLCKCGCGLEVSRPTNKYVLGHSWRKLQLGHIQYARELHEAGWSNKKIGRELGVSDAAISFITRDPSWGDRSKNRGREILRQDEIDARNELVESWRKLKEVREQMNKMRKKSRCQATL